MLFNSFTFITLFLPAVLIVYHLLPQARRNAFSLIASIGFYLWASPVGLAILIAGSMIDFAITKRMEACPSKQSKAPLLYLSIAINLAILIYFKYSNFFMDHVNAALALSGSSPISWRHVALPLGISFIFFQKISYVVDCYQSRISPGQRYLDYLHYLLFFPKIMQGPIAAFSEIVSPPAGSGLEDIYIGLRRFCIGLAKKVLIADVLANTADKVFALQGADLTAGFAWLGALCYTMQIYFDFAGYTDMAVGIAHAMGFRLPENFNRPYLAQNFTEFWQRWHITLSRWFKNYLYIPLGGNRVSSGRVYLNLWIVFLASGLWHGANWTFIAWGAFHGLFITVDRSVAGRVLQKLGGPANQAITFLLLMISWVIFRSASIAEAANYLGAMFAGQSGTSGALLAELISRREVFTLIMALALSFFPEALAERIGGWLAEGKRGEALGAAALVIVFLLSLAAIANQSYKPYIYLVF